MGQAHRGIIMDEVHVSPYELGTFMTTFDNMLD